MVDADAVILDELGHLAPLGGFEGADWGDVLRRANPNERLLAPRRRRRLAVVVAFALLMVAVAVSPLGAAIGREVGDFSGWLTGSPGKPASSAAQKAFEHANARAWAGFPTGTKLRRLITTRADGVNYTLSGFRDADSLCLTVTADGLAHASTMSCAPLRELRARPQPALVLSVDYGVGTLPGKHVTIGPETYSVERASVSFGIVADNVRAVTLRSDDRTRHATVRSDSFLSVAVRPKVGSRVRQITATTRNGKTVAIPFAQAPFDSALGTTPVGTLHGPSHVDRAVHGGTIGWFARRVSRGQPFPAMRSPMGAVNGTRLFGRLLNPDPASGLKVGIEMYKVTHVPAAMKSFEKPGVYVCDVLFAQHSEGSGCNRGLASFFRETPFTGGSLTLGGGDQYSILDGITSDTVARMRLFLATGEVVNVPLKDNAYVIRVARAKFPIRLVAYDDHERVIGIETLQSDMGGPTGPAYQPAKSGHWRILVRVRRADGHTVPLWAIPSQAGGWCWKVKEPGGGEEGGCALPAKRLGAKIQMEISPGPTVGAKAVALAAVGPTITRVIIHYRSGVTAQARPVDGLVFYAPPPSRVAAHDAMTALDGYDAAGKLVTHEPMPGPR